MNPAHHPPGTTSEAHLDAQALVKETVAVVLAGGKGTRLGALTRHECKPALPFAGSYRTIDFSLSNCVNSGITRIGVLTQYQDGSLLQHLARVWRTAGEGGEGFVEPWRAELRAGVGSYRGTADAVFQNWHRIEALDAERVLILAGDHVYQMDYRPMLEQHMANRADLTVGCVEIPIELAGDFGVMSIDQTCRISSFSEKPSHPQCLPGQPKRALGSMGIYVFNRGFLAKILREDALNQSSDHDFGRDLLPCLIQGSRVFAYPFTRNALVGGGYWRDVGTVSAYWHAHMELLDGVPGFCPGDPSWPVRSDGRLQRASVSFNRVQSERALVQHSVLSANVRVAADSELKNAVVLPNAVIGRNCSLTDVVIGAGSHVPSGTVIGPMKSYDGTRGSKPTLVVAETYSIRSRNTVGRWAETRPHS